MRKITACRLKNTFLKTGLALMLVVFGMAGAAQPLPPDHENEDHKPPHGSLGGGLAIMLVLGAAYGSKKVYDSRKRAEKSRAG